MSYVINLKIILIKGFYVYTNTVSIRYRKLLRGDETCILSLENWSMWSKIRSERVINIRIMTG